MTKQEYATLAARYALYLLYNRRVIDTGSAEGCNLWTLLQEGLGGHDDNAATPPLADIVKFVKEQMGE